MSKIAIITARYYESILNEMERGVIAELDSSGYAYEIIEAPGAFELPLATKITWESGKFDGIIALGCVIRGDTTHYDYVCSECSRGLMNLSINHNIPLGFGVLTVENYEQAWERAQINRKNKGGEAAKACLKMISLMKKYK